MMHSAKHSDHLKKVRHVMKSGGYVTGKQNHSMKKIAKAVADKEVHKHEKHEHDGKMTKLKEGGIAAGEKPHHRLDKRSRGGKKSHTSVNVIIPQGGKQAVPVPVGAPAMGAPRPPMAPPPMAAPPGGQPPMGGMRPPMKKGGVPHIEAGAGSGEGRLEKIGMEKKFVKNKAKGGKCS